MTCNCGHDVGWHEYIKHIYRKCHWCECQIYEEELEK